MAEPNHPAPIPVVDRTGASDREAEERFSAVFWGCPVCDYVHKPTKTGFGLTVHIATKHPDECVSMSFDEAVQEALRDA